MSLKKKHNKEVYQKLHQFTRRYYLNNLLQSAGIFIVTSSVLAIVFSLGEYLLRNANNTRAALFYVYFVLELVGFVYLIIIPLLRIWGRAGVMSEEGMSKLIGNRNKDVKDKLLNILMLSDMSKDNDNTILLAAIEQKSKEISRFPFHLSASFKKGIKFLNIAGITLLALIVMGMSFPNVVNYGTKRIIFYNENIEPPAPFSFELQNNLQAIRNERLEIVTKLSGEVLPSKVFIEIDGLQKPTSKIGVDEFDFNINRVSEAFSFRFFAEGYYSEVFEVEVLDRPAIVNFEIEVDYPKYLNKDREIIENIGNLTIPEGTLLNWKIRTNASSRVDLNFDDKAIKLSVSQHLVSFDSVLQRDVAYTISASGQNGLVSDSINYLIDVIPDRRPSIIVHELRDSLNAQSQFFGQYDDDYGISSFRFAYLLNEDNKPRYKQLRSTQNPENQEFIYEVDWNDWDLKKGDKVKCYFEVWDNDGIKGPKVARSNYFTFGLENEEELINKKEALSDDLDEKLEEAVEDAKKLNEEVEELREEIIQNKKMDWNEKQKIEDLLRQNEALKEKLKDIENKNAQKKNLEKRLNHSDEILKKSDELQELLEKILDEDLLEKLKELEDLMEQMSRDDLNESVEDIQMSNEQLEKELDRSLELFRQLEFEMKLEEVTKELDALEKKQSELKEEVLKEGVQEDSREKQEALNEKFDDWQEKMEDLNEKNEKLENQKEMDDMKEERQETEESMQKAKESLEKNQKKNSSKNQQDAQDKMSQMKDDLNALQASMESQSMEDLQSLRNTLENLLELSFNQEALLDEMKGMAGNDPRFNDLTKDQRGVLEGMKVVEDSLNALSKRIVQLEPIIRREVSSSKRNMEKAIRSMTERDVRSISVKQQGAMTSLNNLAVLLDEVVDQIQQQMMQSSGQCSKPGSSKPSSSSMKQMQKQLNEQIEKMKQAMEEGKQKGDKPGKQNSGRSKQDAESLAKMASEQAKIREELRKLEESSSQKDAKELKKIGDMMEETEREIVNRQITRETLMRQEKILTKLLEAENAERERDTEERRESETGENKKKGNLLDLEEYYKAKNVNHESLMKENIGYERFYKEKVEEYFKTITE